MGLFKRIREFFRGSPKPPKWTPTPNEMHQSEGNPANLPPVEKPGGDAWVVTRLWSKDKGYKDYPNNGSEFSDKEIRNADQVIVEIHPQGSYSQRYYRTIIGPVKSQEQVDSIMTVTILPISGRR